MAVKYYVILNDHAGAGRAKAVWPAIEEQLNQQNVTFELGRSQYAGHSILLAHQFAKNHASDPANWVVLAVGGDGTLHQVLNGLNDAHLTTPIPVAYLPVGSGNDFARGLKMANSWRPALNQILDCTAANWLTIGQYRDTIKQSSSVFTNNVGIGLDAAIVAAANSSRLKVFLNRIHMGKLAYPFSFINVVYNQQGFPLTVHVNGHRDIYSKAFLVTVSNHPYFGGGINILPPASVSDANLDLIVVEKPNLFKMIGIALMIALGRHLKMKSVHHYHAAKIHLIAPSIEYGQIDGEELGGKYWDAYFEITQYPFWIDPTI